MSCWKIYRTRGRAEKSHIASTYCCIYVQYPDDTHPTAGMNYGGLPMDRLLDPETNIIGQDWLTASLMSVLLLVMSSVFTT